jgi:hypothetical protein
MLQERFEGRRLRFSDAERALLARKPKALGRKALLELGKIATPDTLMRWHRQLVAAAPRRLCNSPLWGASVDAEAFASGGVKAPLPRAGNHI